MMNLKELKRELEELLPYGEWEVWGGFGDTKLIKTSLNPRVELRYCVTTFKASLTFYARYSDELGEISIKFQLADKAPYFKSVKPTIENMRREIEHIMREVA